MLKRRDVGAVVIGGYVNGLGLVRSLGEMGVPVAVLTTEPFDIAHRSRYARQSPSLDFSARPAANIVQFLLDQARRWRGWALFPTNDDAVEMLAENHQILSSSYQVVSPTPGTVGFFLDKQQMTEVAASLGVRVPRVYGQAKEGWSDPEDLRYPVVVKPTSGHHFSRHFGCKMMVARNAGELEGALSRVLEAQFSAQVMDLVPGRDDQIYSHSTYLNEKSEPLGSVTVRKLRQSPPGFGVARVAEIVKCNAELEEATIEILRRVEHRGPATAEFKYDHRDGTFCFLEVNGRPVIYNRLLSAGGLDVARLAWEERIARGTPRAESNSWRGVWINLHADLLHSLTSRRYEEWKWREYLAPYCRPKVFAVWSAGDPRPFLSQWSTTAREFGGAILRGRVGESIRSRTGRGPGTAALTAIPPTK